MIYTNSIILALTVCTGLLYILAFRPESALARAPIPIFSHFCADTKFAVSSPLPYPDRTPPWTDFPDLLDVECKTLGLISDEVTAGPGFALEMKKAETVMNEFATLARVCNLQTLNDREVLANSLSEFVNDAQKVCDGLTRLRSGTGSTVDK